MSEANFPSHSSSVVVLPPREYSPLAGFLSYLVPGLGQITQGRVSKGVFFMVTLLALFFAGMALGDWRNVYLPNKARGAPNWEDNRWKLPGPFKPLANVIEHRWQFAGQFWIGIAAWPSIWQYNDWPVPDEQTSPFWHNFQRGPNIHRPLDPLNDEENLREYIRTHDKIPDVAWVYTVVAGVLNILVMYDAFAGPAHGRLTPPPKDDAPITAEVAVE